MLVVPAFASVSLGKGNTTKAFLYSLQSIYHIEGEVEKYTRSCSNETCTDEKKKWGCETAQDSKVKSF